MPQTSRQINRPVPYTIEAEGGFGPVQQIRPMLAAQWQTVGDKLTCKWVAQ